MLSIQVTEEAKFDFEEAYNWYYEIDEVLANIFETEIEQALERIRLNWKHYPVVEGSTRKALVKKFPFNVFYLIDDIDGIVVTAILHHRRDPKRWKR